MEQTDLIRRARYGPNTILAAGMSRALNTALNSAESELLLLVLILDRDSGRILDAECNICLLYTSVQEGGGAAQGGGGPIVLLDARQIGHVQGLSLIHI